MLSPLVAFTFHLNRTEILLNLNLCLFPRQKALQVNKGLQNDEKLIRNF